MAPTIVGPAPAMIRLGTTRPQHNGGGGRGFETTQGGTPTANAVRKLKGSRIANLGITCSFSPNPKMVGFAGSRPEPQLKVVPRMCQWGLDRCGTAVGGRQRVSPRCARICHHGPGSSPYSGPGCV